MTRAKPSTPHAVPSPTSASGVRSRATRCLVLFALPGLLCVSCNVRQYDRGNVRLMTRYWPYNTFAYLEIGKPGTGAMFAFPLSRRDAESLFGAAERMSSYFRE